MSYIVTYRFKEEGGEEDVEEDEEVDEDAELWTKALLMLCNKKQKKQNKEMWGQDQGSTNSSASHYIFTFFMSTLVS